MGHPVLTRTKMAKKPHLSCASLLVIQAALDHRERALETLHWQAVAFGATNPLYRNIATECGKLTAARAELAEVYEAQFPKR